MRPERRQFPEPCRGGGSPTTWNVGNTRNLAVAVEAQRLGDLIREILSTFRISRIKSPSRWASTATARFRELPTVEAQRLGDLIREILKVLRSRLDLARGTAPFERRDEEVCFVIHAGERVDDFGAGHHMTRFHRIARKLVENLADQG